MYNTTFNTVIAKKLKFVHAKPRVSKIATIKYAQLIVTVRYEHVQCTCITVAYSPELVNVL